MFIAYVAEQFCKMVFHLQLSIIVSVALHPNIHLMYVFPFNLSGGCMVVLI